MDHDINKCHITGTVERFDRIATKTGTPMIKTLVRCHKESIPVVAFKDLAEATHLEAGDRVDVRGRVQSTSWTGQDGVKRYGWQLVADTIQPLDQANRQPEAPPSRQPPAHQHEMFDRSRPNQFDYQGGPF